MKRTSQYALALSTQLLFTSLSVAAPRDILTELGGETCLRTTKNEEAYLICDSGPLTPEDRATLNAALDARQAKAAVPKPDRRTPRYNACVESLNENYSAVVNYCGKDLDADVTAAYGIWGNTAEKTALYEQVRRREAEMGRVTEERLRKLYSDRRERRRSMTPLEQRIDELEEKLTEPCVYYDKMNISRRCSTP